MRILGKTAAAVAALSLAATPALAAQSGASALSLRAATKSDKSENLAGAPIIALIGIAAIVAGGVIIATDDDDPDSN
ncbi:hypothetical protein ACG3SL_13660 [Sphingomonas sp. CJ20]